MEQVIQVTGLCVVGALLALVVKRGSPETALLLAVGAAVVVALALAGVVKELRQLGLRVIMLSGDNRRTAEAVAAEVGVDAVYAEVLPEDKASFVEAERRAGRTVIMIGDGINDSPALSAANVGIAISDGAAIARGIADITIAADSLWELVQLRQLAMALMNRIQANYRFVIGFNGALIGLGAAGVLPPATSAMLHNLSTLGVSLHSMRALPLPKSGQRF